MIKFAYLDKLKFDNLSKNIFCILAANMSKIAPTGNSYKDDYRSWFCGLKRELEREQRKVILIYSDNELIGFFQYNIDNNNLIMEEIQIRPDWQGKGIFRALYGFLISNLPPEIQNVEAYANKKKEIWRGDQKVRIKADDRYYTLGIPRHWCSISLKKDGKTRYL